MSVKEIGIILHGATGRIGATQHLANALAPIRAEGGIRSNSRCIMPRLLLVGRNDERLAAVAQILDIAHLELGGRGLEDCGRHGAFPCPVCFMLPGSAS